jgi:hypothetical protein
VSEAFRLTLDKEKVQKAIDEARKKKGDWAAFQILYDLHPTIKYYMTKLEASVPKDQALAAKLSGKFEKGTAWYILHGQVSNNLGQPVISDFFAVGHDGKKVTECISIADFVERFELNKDLYTEDVSGTELTELSGRLTEVIDFAQDDWMMAEQNRLGNVMLEKSVAYEKHLSNWRSASLKNLEINFEDTTESIFSKTKKERQLEEIHNIADGSSQFMKDMLALDQEAYIKVMAVFFNA